MFKAKENIGTKNKVGSHSKKTNTNAKNIFDRLYYTQIGLPEARRQYFFGMNLLL